VLLHGSINAQLDADPGAVATRRRLQPLLQELAGRLARPETRESSPLSCPLAPRGGGAPLLRASRRAFAQLQAVINQQLACGLGGGRAVQGVAACHGGHLLWSTLGAGDTAALWALAARGPLLAVRAGGKHRTVGGRAGGRGAGSGRGRAPTARRAGEGAGAARGRRGGRGGRRGARAPHGGRPGGRAGP
jgi:hypothetical protein